MRLKTASTTSTARAFALDRLRQLGGGHETDVCRGHVSHPSSVFRYLSNQVMTRVQACCAAPWT
jgi:hypothetical protein